jgi:hypothetical protein
MDIKLQEDLTIKNGDQKIILEKGDRIKIFSENIFIDREYPDNIEEYATEVYNACEKFINDYTNNVPSAFLKAVKECSISLLNDKLLADNDYKNLTKNKTYYFISFDIKTKDLELEVQNYYRRDRKDDDIISMFFYKDLDFISLFVESLNYSLKSLSRRDLNFNKIGNRAFRACIAAYIKDVFVSLSKEIKNYADIQIQ